MDLDRLDAIAAACGPPVYTALASLLPSLPAPLLTEIANAAVAGVRLALYARAPRIEAERIAIVDLRTEDPEL